MRPLLFDQRSNIFHKLLFITFFFGLTLDTFNFLHCIDVLACKDDDENMYVNSKKGVLGFRGLNCGAAFEAVPDHLGKKGEGGEKVLGPVGQGGDSWLDRPLVIILQSGPNLIEGTARCNCTI